jgi:tol-pal system protein YbgF
VQLGGEDGRENDDPNDPAARPEIRVVGVPGSGGSSRPVRSKAGRLGLIDEGPRESGSEPRPSVLDPEAKRAYENAISLVNGKQYDRALEAINAFLVRWPDHPYAENATYWRGEVLFAQGEYLKAAEQFEAVLARYGGVKAPDALLKIGMAHQRLGSSTRAQEYWDRLKRDYPRSDAAKKIPGAAPPEPKGAKGPKETR